MLKIGLFWRFWRLEIVKKMGSKIWEAGSARLKYFTAVSGSFRVCFRSVSQLRGVCFAGSVFCAIKFFSESFRAADLDARRDGVVVSASVVWLVFMAFHFCWGAKSGRRREWRSTWTACVAERSWPVCGNRPVRNAQRADQLLSPISSTSIA